MKWGLNVTVFYTLAIKQTEGVGQISCLQTEPTWRGRNVKDQDNDEF